ncbi:MAG: 5'/3'-nucleotidase SurE [Proteobacteria bacterium]|nr:5'/3'-nucleotidase SurE [Pseudomonadota bacterium]
MQILLTNDDSHDSPLFLLALKELQQHGDVTVVVPAQEQSWKGKSMTRYGQLYVDRIDLHGYPAWSVTGTPADCVNLGIHNLMPVRPDLVVSGINIGINTGLGFVMASGTVGAALEANIAGLPGLALSQELKFDEYIAWSNDRCFDDACIEEVSAIFRQMLPLMWEQLVTGQSDSTTWNVNLPRELRAPEIVRTRMGHSFYGRVFSQKGDQYFHQLERFPTDQAPDTDQMVVSHGRVSATRLDIRDLGQIIPD